MAEYVPDNHIYQCECEACNAYEQGYEQGFHDGTIPEKKPERIEFESKTIPGYVNPLTNIRQAFKKGQRAYDLAQTHVEHDAIEAIKLCEQAVAHLQVSITALKERK